MRRAARAECRASELTLAEFSRHTGISPYVIQSRFGGWAELRERFAAYGLELHPEKTRLIPFRRPRSGRDGSSGPGTFDFLGGAPPIFSRQYFAGVTCDGRIAR